MSRTTPERNNPEIWTLVEDELGLRFPFKSNGGETYTINPGALPYPNGNAADVPPSDMVDELAEQIVRATQRYDELAQLPAADIARQVQALQTTRDSNNLQSVAANFSYWVRLDYWTLHEGVLLIFGVDPDKTRRKSLTHIFNRATLEQLHRTQEMARKTFIDPNLEKQVAPEEFLQWADINNIAVDPELGRARIEQSIHSQSFQSFLWRLIESESKHQEQNKDIARLSARIVASSSAELSRKSAPEPYLAAIAGLITLLGIDTRDEANYDGIVDLIAQTEQGVDRELAREILEEVRKRL